MTEARATLEAALADAEALAGRLRAALAEMDGEAVTDEIAAPRTRVHEFRDELLITPNIAAQRTGVPEDTIRRWADQTRDTADAIGVQGPTGRWRICPKRLGTLIDGKGLRRRCD